MPISYNIACLSVFPERVALMLRYMSLCEPWQGLDTMYVILHDVDEYDESIKRFAPDWLKLEFINVTARADELAAGLPPAFFDYYRNPKARWALGIKFLIPLIIQPPLLYVDDDVIIPKDPAPLIEANVGFCGTAPFDRIPWTIHSLTMCQELGSIFGIDIDPGDYNDVNLETGHWWASSLPDYAENLCKFWDCNFIKSMVRSSNPFRTLDLRFFTAHAIKHRWHVLRSTKEHRIYQQSPLKSVPRSYHADTHFIHYCASSHKEAYMRFYDELYELIKATGIKPTRPVPDVYKSFDRDYWLVQ